MLLLFCYFHDFLKNIVLLNLFRQPYLGQYPVGVPQIWHSRGQKSGDQGEIHQERDKGAPGPDWMPKQTPRAHLGDDKGPGEAS